MIIVYFSLLHAPFAKRSPGSFEGNAVDTGIINTPLEPLWFLILLSINEIPREHIAAPVRPIDKIQYTKFGTVTHIKSPKLVDS